jgi:anti-anti-sigma factor
MDIANFADPPPFVVELRDKLADGPPVIVVAGEVDADNCDDFTQQVTELLDRVPAGRVVLDLGELTYVGSAGVRALMLCHDAAERRGITLEVGRIHENALRVLVVCDLTELFRVPVTPCS